jgi:hypothetical protein
LGALATPFSRQVQAALGQLQQVARSVVLIDAQAVMYLLAICTGKVADADKVIHTNALDAFQLVNVALGLDGGDGGTSGSPHLKDCSCSGPNRSY